jgi:hypothetical protein
MRSTRSECLIQVVTLLACALILKTIAGVILDYAHYLPPDFESGFLHGRQSYFWNGYQWAFYLHITSGPCTLVFGLVLMSEQLRLRFSRFHRCLGKLQIACVLLLVTPSGVWMSFYVEMGEFAGLGFGLLGVATGLCAVMGWRSAATRRFSEHRTWMWRCFLLLCSAVVLRLIAGAFSFAGIHGEWTYVSGAWASWLVPLAAFELMQSRHFGNGGRPRTIKSASEYTRLPGSNLRLNMSGHVSKEPPERIQQYR